MSNLDQDLNPGCLTPEPVFFSTIEHHVLCAVIMCIGYYRLIANPVVQSVVREQTSRFGSRLCRDPAPPSNCQVVWI